MNRLLATLLLLASISPVLAQRPPQRQDYSLSQSEIEDLPLRSLLGIADLSRARPIPDLALDLIIVFEGWSAEYYDDPSNYCTIGYGHLIDLQPCVNIDLVSLNFDKPISKENGRSILLDDTVTARLAVSTMVKVSLTQDQFGALVSFVFNVGKENFRRSTMLRLINAGLLDQVPRELSRWVSSKGIIYNGLVRRRGCEAKLFVSQLTPKDIEHTDNCEPLGAAEPVQTIDIWRGEDRT